jgi:hypothetical protein
MKRFLTTLAVLALVAGLCLPTLAQESAVKGNLGGVVHDISGAVVQGAKVTLTGPMGTKTVTSDAQGDFMFSLMQPGTYTLVVEKQGFRKAELKAVEVFVGKTSSIKFALQPGAVSETVEVSANALSVDTVSTSVSSNLNDTLFRSVPVASGVQNLFYAAPGVVSGGKSAVQSRTTAAAPIR